MRIPPWAIVARKMQRWAESLKPDAEVGQRVRGGNPGGRPPKGPDDDVLRDEVLALHETHPDDSWTQVCDFVARQHGLNGRTVRNRIPDTKW